MNRRTFLKGTAISTAALALPQAAWPAQTDFDPIRKEIEKRHDEALQRLRETEQIAAQKNRLAEISNAVFYEALEKTTEQKIPRDQIASMVTSRLSLMPQELEKAMSKQDLADLIGFLKGE